MKGCEYHDKTGCVLTFNLESDELVGYPSFIMEGNYRFVRV